MICTTGRSLGMRGAGRQASGSARVRRAHLQVGLSHYTLRRTRRQAPASRGAVLRNAFAALAYAWFLASSSLLAQTPALPRAGAANAPVVLTLFADLGSEPAAQAATVLRALLERYPERVAVEFRLRPADGQMHPAEAAVVAATEQQRGWEMVELLLANQDRRHGRDFTAMAAQLRIDADLFASTMSNEDAARVRVEADLAEAAALKLPKGTIVVADGKPVKPTVADIEAQFASLLGTPKF